MQTILLVEDDAIIGMGEAALLENNGYRAVTAHNAEQAIERTRERQIDLILMDIDLGPGRMNGTQAAEIILAERTVPIVFLTSHTEKEYVEKVKKISGYGYVLKHSGEFVLMQSIAMAFNLFQANYAYSAQTKAIEEAHKELSLTHATLMAALDNSQAGIAIADAPDGRLRYVNDAGLRIRGADPDRVVRDVGTNEYVSTWQLFDLDGAPLETDAVPLTRAVMFGEKNGREFIVRGDDHQDRYVLANAAPVHGSNGEVSSAIVIFLDVTEQKRTAQALKESEEKYRDLFNSIRDAIVVADTDRTITDCNPAFSDLFGYTPEELKGQQTATLYQDEAEYHRVGEALREHRGNLADFLLTVQFRKKDGSVFAGETNVFYFHDDQKEITGFIGLIRDTSTYPVREQTSVGILS